MNDETQRRTDSKRIEAERSAKAPPNWGFLDSEFRDVYRLVSIKVIGLFGYLDHTIELMPDGLTILHGPNGAGKTTVLKIVHSIFHLSKEWKVLVDFDFKKIELSFSDGAVVSISKFAMGGGVSWMSPLDIVPDSGPVNGERIWHELFGFEQMIFFDSAGFSFNPVSDYWNAGGESYPSREYLTQLKETKAKLQDEVLVVRDSLKEQERFAVNIEGVSTNPVDSVNELKVKEFLASVQRQLEDQLSEEFWNVDHYGPDLVVDGDSYFEYLPYQREALSNEFYKNKCRIDFISEFLDLVKVYERGKSFCLYAGSKKGNLKPGKLRQSLGRVHSAAEADYMPLLTPTNYGRAFLISSDRLVGDFYDEEAAARVPVPSRGKINSRLADKKQWLAINANAKRMRIRIGRATAKFTRVSQRLDRSFAFRVLSESSVPEETLDEAEFESVKGKYFTHVEIWNELERTGLINESEARPETLELVDARNFDTSERTLLRVLVKDMEEKLCCYEELLEKTKVFLSFVNERLLGKSMRCSRREGFVVVRENERSDECSFRGDVFGDIPLNALSTGEQQIIVLAYQLIFEISDQATIFIDEPEISLHVDWQRSFLDSIDKIRALGGHDVIIATHSPQIVADRVGNMVCLSSC